MGTNLSEEELRQAAAEAGISPRELRVALAERYGGVPDPTRQSVIGPPSRGISANFVEGRIGMTRKDVLDAVRVSIERQTTKGGHYQGSEEADIVDDDNGLTYRIRTASDGSNGALARIDIDPTQGRGTQALVTTGVVGVTSTLVGLGWLFGSAMLWLGGLGFAALGGLLIARSVLNLHRATRTAKGIAAQALLEAEDQAGEWRALPPG